MATGQHSVTAHKLSAEQANLVRCALESVISSDAFAPSKRCQDFLRLVVEHALAGDLDSLSERMIGAEMFRRSEEHTSELQSLRHLVCRLLLEKKKKKKLPSLLQRILSLCYAITHHRQ